jgi:hypothetical protein
MALKINVGLPKKLCIFSEFPGGCKSTTVVLGW